MAFAPYRPPRVVNELGRRVLVQPPGPSYRPRRVLSGVAVPVEEGGMQPVSPYTRDTWAGADPVRVGANEQDDNVGNGIFDGGGTPPVQNAGNGIFESRWSEPGWLYRERLTRPGQIVDVRTGFPVVSLPAGTSWPSELAEAYRPWDDETPRYYGKGKPTGLAGILPESMATASPIEYAIAGLIAGAAAAVLSRYLKKRG
jgi:hypothetical protein